MNSAALTIAIVGGTGKEGAGLAFRWALHGHRVIVGSRDPAKAGAAAAEIAARIPDRSRITGAANGDGARTAEIVVLAVPYAAQPYGSDTAA